MKMNGEFGVAENIFEELAIFEPMDFFAKNIVLRSLSKREIVRLIMDRNERFVGK